MATAIDILSWIFLTGGSFFVLTGGLGVLRMPDVYTRSHAAGVTDTMGAILVIAGLLLQIEGWQVGVKLLLILVFLLVTSPTSSHALNHTAWACGLKPVLDSPPPVSQPDAEGD